LKLDSLTLINFRRFKTLEVDFHPDLTVLGAKNGQGKTTVLDAATIALGTFVGAFDLGKSKSINQKDVRFHRAPNQTESEQVFPTRVEARLSMLSGPVIRELTGAKGKTTIKDAAELTRLGRTLMEQVRSLQPVDLPLMAYYGSGRLWNAHKNMSRKAVLSESRTMGYEDCFSAASSFTQVQQWMSKATLAALQQQNLDPDRGHYIAGQIQGIQRAVDSVLSVEGWEGFHYSVQHEELAIGHPTIGALPVSLLSDGVRAMVSLVADMAWRCVKLNTHMGEQAARLTAGIVFIDEVDMHLHPQWQQRVIGTLRDAFPRIQLVVTTHSPQVLSTVDAESIRLLRHEFDPENGETVSQAVRPLMQSRGVASSDVMADLQEVDPVPRVQEAQWLAEYKALVTSMEQGQDLEERMQVLKSKIINHFGENHSVWLECQRLERLQEMKSRLGKSKPFEPVNR
jgi:predicted ATP-binding protein involved in virulence